MKISIVVPVYNCEKYVGDCIESVINQTNGNWELILVNDGSTDKSAEICNSYADKYSQKIFAFHKENEGQFLTRKSGILKCTGDYIGFLDADDLLDKDYIKILLQNIEKYGLPDAICFGFSQFDNNHTKECRLTDTTVLYKTPDERKTVYEMIIGGKLSGSLCSKIFKNDVVKKHIPEEETVKSKRFAEDAYHSFDALANSESVLFLNKTLYRYRNNEQGFSQGFENRNPDYFNSKYLFELLENNLAVMGLDNAVTKEKLYERNFNETVYFMLRYFRAAKNLKRKKEITDFDWSGYLLKGTLELIEGNNNISKSHLKVWNAFRNRKYFTIFFREKFKKITGW